MKEEVRQLKVLREKIGSTWSLLDIDTLATEGRALEAEMQDPEFWKDADAAKKTSKRHDEIRKEVDIWTTMKKEVDDLLELAAELEAHTDPAMADEVTRRVGELEKQFRDLEFFLLFNGKYDKRNAIVAFHAGSGGTEAQDWTEMLRRMIVRYAEKRGWSVTVLDESRGGEAGLKSSVIRVEGRYAYGSLKSEHGTHRLVRISPFDAEQMRHTSFALIEVIPELDTSEGVQIDPKELRIDTFMSGGHGGQSVNTTYSAVRIVHIPTGITVQCQNERSQMQNKDVAMRVLQSKLQKLKDEEEEKERLKIRGEYKSAEWGNQIRSYVLHPYKLVKDVRTKYETADPDAVLNGELDPFVEAYLKWLKTK
jgi:peptide chain release factor 2